MRQKRERIIPVIPAVILTCLWGIILLVGERPAVVSWWLLPPAGVAGIVFLIQAVLRIFRARRPDIFAILTLLFSAIAIWPLLWYAGIGNLAFPAGIGKTGPAVSVRSPFNEEVLTGWGGDSLEVNYHAAVPVERWAYDFIRAPHDKGIFGLEVVAPASGTVVELRSDLPDHPAGDYPVKFSRMKGNYIYLKLDQTGTFLLLAHFMEDSIVVEEGEHVSEGDPLGRVGNSGSSSEPHLHIHHQKDSPHESSLFTARGLPLYFRQEGGPRMPEGGVVIENGEEIPCGEVLYPYVGNIEEMNQ